METKTINPGEGNYTGEKVNVEMTPGQWIEYRTNQYRARGNVVDIDTRVAAIIDFLDTYFKK